MNQAIHAHYRSYLLRCWAEYETQSGLTMWRFSLEESQSGQRRGFASLTDLVIALQDELVGKNQAYEVGSRK